MTLTPIAPRQGNPVLINPREAIGSGKAGEGTCGVPPATRRVTP